MKTEPKLLIGLVVSIAFLACLTGPAHGAWELVKAFAIGADDWTRATYNEPSVMYIKIDQPDEGASLAPITYPMTADTLSYGYTDLAGLDASPNNRGVYSGDDEIYDQFIGAKLSASPNPLLFRVDVENGNYKFIGAGGDASNSNHGTTMWARDGDTGTRILLCDDFLPTANGEFWRCEFDDKVVPPASASPPTFPAGDRIECPFLEVTQGYIIIEQAVGSHPDGNGGDFCLLEVWQFKGATAGPDQTVTAGTTVTLSGAGPDDTTSFTWEQIIVGDEPTVTIADPTSASTTFDSPVAEIGYVLTIQLTVVSPSQGTTTDSLQVTCLAPNEPRLAPANIRITVRHLGFTLEWDPLLDATEYGVGIKISEGVYFWFSTPDTHYNLTNLSEGDATTVAVRGKNGYGDGVLSDDIALVAMRNAALATGTTPPSAYVSLSGGDVPGMNNGAYDDNNDSSDGQFKTEDYWGYLWGAPMAFDHIVYYTGGFASNGGWFTSLTVQYTQDGTTWIEAPGVTISPPYDFTNSASGRVNFTRYDISLWPLRGTGIRIYGTPGGNFIETATSVAELEVYGDTSRGPLVVYGVDATFDEYSQAVLDGSHSFSERGDLSGFGWVQTGGPTVDITDANQAMASFAAPGVDADTVLTFQFTAGDGTDTDTDEVSITVRNLVTTAVAGVDQTVSEGAAVNFDGTGSLTTSGNITYTWTQTEGTEAILTGADTATPSFTAPAIWDNTDELVFSLNVQDGVGGDSTDTVNVYVNNSMFFAPAEEGDMADDPWHLSAQDIYPAPPATPGSSSYALATDTYSVTANGNDIWGTNDQFRFLFLEVPQGVGDFSVSVRVDGPPAGETWPDAWTKAGIMFRQDLDANSKDMYLICSRDNGIAMQYRTTKGAGAARQGGAASQQPYVNGTNNFAGPVWLKLERQGDLFLGYYSFDGIQWLRGPWDYPRHHTIAMDGPFYVGICLTSHTTASTGTAVFGDLRFKDQEAHVITDAYAFRTLEAGYEPGGTTDVSLSVRTNPDNPPATVSVMENIPTGLSAVPGSITNGGTVVGNNITWTLTGGGVTDVGYSLQVPGGTSGALNFAGSVSFPGTTVDIYGDDIIYEVPLAPANLYVEMLLAAHLNWSASPSEGVVGYRVYRSENGQPWEEIGFAYGTSFTDGSIVDGSTYNYQAAAVNAAGVEGDPSAPTGEKMIVMEVREAEDYNYGGGQWPGYTSCPAALEAPDAATVGTPQEYDFYFNNSYPVGDPVRAYRPLDDVFTEVREDTPNIGGMTVDDWHRYTFNVPVPGPSDPPEGWVRIVLKVASPGGGTADLYWDETLVESLTFVTGDWGIFQDVSTEEYFQTTPGLHTLRVALASGGMNIDKIGMGFNWSAPTIETLFEDDFEEHTALYDPINVEWTLVSGSGAGDGTWRLWNTAGNNLGNESPALDAMTNNYAITDSDLAGAVDVDEELITPTIDCTGHRLARLNFNMNYRVYTEDTDPTHTQNADVDLRSSDDGVTWGGWVNLLSWDRTTVAETASGAEEVDISALADGKFFQVRWRFYNANFDYWFAVDDVRIIADRIDIPPPTGKILSVGYVAGVADLTWETFGGGNYTVQYTTDLTSGSWDPVPGTTWPITATDWSGDISAILGQGAYLRVRSD